jgi:hypothetical protein
MYAEYPTRSQKIQKKHPWVEIKRKEEKRPPWRLIGESKFHQSIYIS